MRQDDARGQAGPHAHSTAHTPSRGELGSASNPHKPGESRPGWDDESFGNGVVHSSIKPFAHDR